MQCKHPLVKKLRKAGASTKSAVRVVSSMGSKWVNHCTKNYGDDIGYMFSFASQPEGHSYWQKINKRMGY